MTGLVMVTKGGRCGGKGGKSSEEEQNQLSLVAVLVAALRKSMVACRVDRGDDVMSTVHQMEIGWPTNFQHITHVTFDRFNGFLGLPVEFEVEIPGRVPSARFCSASVFGVSAESMQCSYDSAGNSVPTILLLMQERLYSQGGLKAEGIFRINPENSQEERVRDQLNRGIVPDNIDVHCLAGLIKAWFRELPSGVLDGLSPEQVLQCNTEEESVELVKQLKPTETALLNWAVDLMADVVEEEESNKMNARNIAMVFAPNMTQMSDPLTTLMHAVQVMNLLKTLIMKTLRDREESVIRGLSPMSSRSSNQEIDEDFDSQQEMDMSCELRGEALDKSNNDDNTHHNLSSEDEDEDEDEVESLGEIEESFLRQLDENNNATISLSEQLENDLRLEDASPPMSSRSSNQEIDEDFDSQQEMDMSCALRGDALDKSDNDDNTPQNLSSEDEDEVESLGEIEESFLRQLDENNNTTISLSKQPENDLRLEHASPLMSSCSSNQEIDEDFDSQQEMDMSCELRGEASDKSDNDDNAPQNLNSEHEDEVESLGEIEESFLRQLDENNNGTISLSEQPENDLRLEHASPSCCMGSNVEFGISGVSLTESKNGKSSSSLMATSFIKLTNGLNIFKFNIILIKFLSFKVIQSSLIMIIIIIIYFNTPSNSS